jgi:hypothetical protein
MIDFDIIENKYKDLIQKATQIYKCVANNIEKRYLLEN